MITARYFVSFGGFNIFLPSMSDSRRLVLGRHSSRLFFQKFQELVPVTYTILVAPAAYVENGNHAPDL